MKKMKKRKRKKKKEEGGEEEGEGERTLVQGDADGRTLMGGTELGLVARG